MNPVVVIATHNRLNITSANILKLQEQTIVPKIVLVVSDRKEMEYYKAQFQSITIVQFPNEPLGNKWQTGVSVAKTLGANPLIVLGSDDILGLRFVEEACKKIESGIHFIGLKTYWVHEKGKAYLINYQPLQPIGGGRVYSEEMLKRIKYKVFDTSKKRHLDDLGFSFAKSSGLKYELIDSIDTFELHAIKGDWAMMNPFNPHHRNVRVVRTEVSKNVFQW